MQVMLQIIGRNITPRFGTPTASVVSRPEPPQGCVHYDTKETEKGIHRIRCSRQVEAGKPNGYLCKEHQRTIDHQFSREVDPSIDAAFIVSMEAALIEEEFLYGNPARRTSLRLSDFRYCRREWNQRSRPLEAKLIDSASTNAGQFRPVLFAPFGVRSLS